MWTSPRPGDLDLARHGVAYADSDARCITARSREVVYDMLRDSSRHAVRCVLSVRVLQSGGVTAKGAGKNVENHDRRGGAPPLRTGGVDLGVGCDFGDAPCITKVVDREATRPRLAVKWTTNQADRESSTVMHGASPVTSGTLTRALGLFAAEPTRGLQPHPTACSVMHRASPGVQVDVMHGASPHGRHAAGDIKGGGSIPVRSI